MTDLAKPTTIADVYARLAALGDTCNAVADTLFAAGHLGRRGSVTACPVSRFLEDSPDIDRAHAMPIESVVYTADAALIVPTPKPVGRFMQLFDCGFYDALVEKASERAA